LLEYTFDSLLNVLFVIVCDHANADLHHESSGLENAGTTLRLDSHLMIIFAPFKGP
jgi:hypothetical protein